MSTVHFLVVNGSIRENEIQSEAIPVWLIPHIKKIRAGEAGRFNKTKLWIQRIESLKTILKELQPGDVILFTQDLWMRGEQAMLRAFAQTDAILMLLCAFNREHAVSAAKAKPELDYALFPPKPGAQDTETFENFLKTVQKQTRTVVC